MRNAGLGALGLGVLLLITAFGYDTAPEGTHNIGLLQEQMMRFSLACVLILSGVMAAVVGQAVTRMEQAGLLPPSGHEVVPPQKQSA